MRPPTMTLAELNDIRARTPRTRDAMVTLSADVLRQIIDDAAEYQHARRLNTRLHRRIQTMERIMARVHWRCWLDEMKAARRASVLHPNKKEEP